MSGIIPKKGNKIYKARTVRPMDRGCRFPENPLNHGRSSYAGIAVAERLRDLKHRSKSCGLEPDLHPRNQQHPRAHEVLQ